LLLWSASICASCTLKFQINNNSLIPTEILTIFSSKSWIILEVLFWLQSWNFIWFMFPNSKYLCVLNCLSFCCEDSNGTLLHKIRTSIDSFLTIGIYRATAHSTFSSEGPAIDQQMLQAHKDWVIVRNCIYIHKIWIKKFGMQRKSSNEPEESCNTFLPCKQRLIIFVLSCNE